MAVTQLNYAAKAIVDLQETARGLTHYPQTYAMYQLICDLLDKADKFIMPNCCDLIDPDKFSARDYALLKVPYPLTVFEAPWIQETERKIPSQFATETSQKRIALLIESQHPAMQNISDIYGNPLRDNDGVMMIAIYHVGNKWNLHIGGFFLPYNVDPSAITELSGLIGKRSRQYIESGYASKKGQLVETVPVFLMPEIINLMAKQTGIETVITDLLDNSRDEMMMTLQACAIINCENIESEDLFVPKKLQESRKKKGKPPLHEYKVLNIGAEFYKIPSGNSSGGKSGPKMHKRRGHIRRLSDDRQTWVRHTVVNAGVKGSITKTYSVSVPPKS